MEKIEKIWYVKENELSKPLWKFHVSIKVLQEEEKLVFSLVIVNEERERLIYNFDSLEEAVFFIEEVVSKAKDYNEIKDKYNEIYSEENIKERVKIKEKIKRANF